MPFARLPEGDIYYETHGPAIQKQSIPIIVLRPFSRGPLGVQPYIDRLAANFSVISYDQRGLGQSPASLTPGPVAMSARAAEVLGLIDSLSIDTIHLSCHSTGCGIGLSIVNAAPERVTSLTLISPWTHADSYLKRMQDLRVAAARSLDPADYFRFNISLLYPPAYRREHERGFAKMELAAQDTEVDANFISNGLIPILAFDSRKITPTVECPTLVAIGNDDQLMPTWFGHSIANDIPTAELVRFDNAGHMIPETRTEELAAAVSSFINDRCQ